MATESSPPPPAESQIPSIVPIDIVSDDEMAFLKAALASARPLLSLSPPRSPLIPHLSMALSPSRGHATSIRSGSSSPVDDIEDSGKLIRPVSYLERFRHRRALAVTDITGSEWCQKQKEFELTYGKPERTEAMEAGSRRHSELEKEVIERIDIRTESLEEFWTIKFFNFIVGTHQLLSEGLTRELPVIGVFQDIWITGIIDEVRMPVNEVSLSPVLVDTKTRYKATLPTEAQKRNARLQLMYYKYLFDGLVTSAFPTEHFFKHFGLDPHYTLSEDVRQYTASLGFDIKTFEDVIASFIEICSFLCPAHDQLKIRYELQSDRSLLEEYHFAYDASWLNEQTAESLKFWSGEKDASYVSNTEIWKCRFCKFNTICPMASNSTFRVR